jgi:hypothetical protein
MLASLLATALIGSFIGMTHKKALPSTGYIPADVLKETNQLPSLQQFASSVKNGQRGAVVGIYIPGVLALPVGQQPKDNAGYVTRQPEQATQFSMAGKYGTVGILAHNDLAGAEFSDIQLDHEAVVIYGNGHEEFYLTSEIQKYQALSPTSTFSDFINLDGSSERLTAGQLFTRIYGPGNRLVFQTCIDAHGDASWGRLFIIARPTFDPVLSVVEQTTSLLDFSSFGMAYR